MNSPELVCSIARRNINNFAGADYRMERKKIVKTLCRNAGVKYFRYHALRHAGASVMDKNNVPIGAIQRILGHENRTTTEIYLHSIGNTEREAIAVLERSADDTKTNSHTDSHTEA